jgi:hypothetical protein
MQAMLNTVVGEHSAGESPATTSIVRIPEGPAVFSAPSKPNNPKKTALPQCPIALAQIKMMENVKKILKKQCVYHIPITADIGNIKKCDAYIVCRETYIKIQIDPKNLNACDDTDWTFKIRGDSIAYTHPKETCAVELAVKFAKLLKILRRLKFTKFVGDFYDPEDEHECATLENEELSVAAGLSVCDDCCVCQEKTQTKTECGHTLCHECWNRIERHVCPMCRGELTTRNPEIEDDEDDDDSAVHATTTTTALRMEIMEQRLRELTEVIEDGTVDVGNPVQPFEEYLADRLALRE